MKNTIIVNCGSNFSTDLSVEKTEENSIWFCFLNVGSGASMEIFYGADYQETIRVSENQPVSIPLRYCSDNEILRIRYVDNAVKSNFIIVYGDESASKVLYLRRRNKYLYTCTSSGGNAGPVVKQTEDEKYMKLLAALISSTTEPKPKSCYTDLKRIRTGYIMELYRLGVVGKDTTMADILELMKKITKSNPFDVMHCEIAAFSLNADIIEPVKVTLKEV